LKCAEDGLIDRVTHPKVICVDDQQAGVCRVSEQTVCLAFIRGGQFENLLNQSMKLTTKTEVPGFC